MTKDWRRHSLTWGKRLTIVILIVGGLVYGVLSLAQRSPEALRKGLEDYLSKATGSRGEITDLKEARLTPDVSFNIQGIYIRDWQDSKKTYAHADSAYISIPFWRMLLGSAQYAAMEIKGLEIATGYLLPQKLTLRFAGISDPAPDKAAPQFIADGEYNKLPLLATVEMTRNLTKKGPLYAFAPNSLITFKLGETEGEGLVIRHFSSVSLESARLERGDLAAEFTAEDIHENPLNVKLKGKIGGAPFNGVLTKEGENTLLQITPETDKPEEIKAIKRLTDAVKGDLGLSGKDEKIRIEIIGAENNIPPQETPKDSKKK